MARNVVKAEMRRRVSGANQAVVADTRPKVERKRKGMASYDRRLGKAEARDGARGRDGEAIAVA